MPLLAIDHPQPAHGRVEQINAIGDRRQSPIVVRDDDRRLAVGLVRALNQAGDLRAGGGVEPRGRLVVQDHGGVEGQRAGDGQPLPLPAREGSSAHVVRHAQLGQQPGRLELRPAGATARSVLDGAAMLCREPHIIQWRQFIE